MPAAYWEVPEQAGGVALVALHQVAFPDISGLVTEEAAALAAEAAASLAGRLTARDR